jgi:hypothetical protein
MTIYQADEHAAENIVWRAGGNASDRGPFDPTATIPVDAAGTAASTRTRLPARRP